MSALHKIESSVTIPEVEALQCMSYSSSRPSLTTQQIQEKAGRAIAFCIQYNLEPSTYRLAKVSGLKKMYILDYFNGVEKIKEIMLFRANLKTMKFYNKEFSTIKWHSHYNSLNACDVLGDLTPICLNPYDYTFHTLEQVLGLSGYSIFKSSVKTLTTKGIDSVTDTFSVLSAIELKREKYIHHHTSLTKAITLGSSVAKIIRAIAYSDGRIYHSATFLDYVSRYDKDNLIIHQCEDEKFDGLFHRKDGTGNVFYGSYRFMTTRRGNHFVSRVVDMFMDLVLETSIREAHEADFIIDLDTMKRLIVRDQFILLSRCVGMIDGKFHISNTINDNGITRVYGLMTMLTSNARDILQYNQYDITSALQSIVIEQLESRGLAAKNRYPTHYELVQDRRAFRAIVASETGKEISWVKEKLTSIDNGGAVNQKYLKLSPMLKEYKDESNDFAMEYLDSIPPQQLIRAQQLTYQADIAEDWVKADIRKGKRFEDGRKKFGVFFHAWTQTERYVRELMKPHFKGYCHDIHDAIASKENVDVNVLNQEITDAGFKYIKIEK